MGDDTWTSLYPTYFSRSYPFPSFNTRCCLRANCSRNSVFFPLCRSCSGSNSGGMIVVVVVAAAAAAVAVISAVVLVVVAVVARFSRLGVAPECLCLGESRASPTSYSISQFAMMIVGRYLSVEMMLAPDFLVEMSSGRGRGQSKTSASRPSQCFPWSGTMLSVPGDVRVLSP